MRVDSHCSGIWAIDKCTRAFTPVDTRVIIIIASLLTLAYLDVGACIRNAW